MIIDIISIARVCYEADRALRYALGADPIPSWTDAPAASIDAAVDRVRLVLRGQTRRPDPETPEALYDALDTMIVALLAPYLLPEQQPRPPAQVLGVEGIDATRMMGEQR